MQKQTIKASVSLFVLVAAGCGRVAEDCDLALTCPGYAHGDATTGDAGPKPETPPECKLLPSQDGFRPNEKCGVFAAPSAMSSGGSGDGSMALPFATLMAAVEAAAATGKVVYACADVFEESLRVPSGVRIYGGLDCTAEWAYAAGKRTVVAPVSAATPLGSEIAARLSAGVGTTILEDVDIVSPSAAAPGASSIALLIEDTKADLARCTLTSGDGKSGVVGAHAADESALDGFDGDVGYNTCGATTENPGPKGPMKVCGVFASQGGDGGEGGPPPSDPAGDGTPGIPADALSPAAGLGGAGQSVTACTPGIQGADGARGVPGEGGLGPGTLSIDGYAGAPGASGKRGLPGQGGGGGGGSKGKSQVACPNTATLARAGASGGSGGTGGCGGDGGQGGQAGGSSIAMAILSKSVVVLTDVALKVGRGGDGGAGGAGQNGGNGGFGKSGGQGASGTANGCHGGDGGHGGAGGPGGGGAGGHAIGLAYTGPLPKGALVVTHTAGSPTPGKGGAPGAASVPPTGSGENGSGGDRVSFGGM